jgi:predicted dehydrogenase
MTEERAPLRVALIGYGLAGEYFHAPFITTTPGLELATVVTSNEGRAARARARCPGVRVLARADELWPLAAEHDLVVVASPNRVHHEQAAAAIAAGLHVVIDKPVTPTAAEGWELIELARRRGVALTVFQNRRWDAEIRTLRRLLGEGALGEVWRFESRFERWRPRPDLGQWREHGDPREAGGLLFDLGAHLVDQAVLLFGWPTEVYAEVRRRRPGVAVDDDAFLALCHPGGEISHLWVSATAAHLGPRLRVLGSTAAYVVDTLDGQELKLLAGIRPDDPAFGEVPPERWGRLVVGDVASPVPSEPGHYGPFYVGVVAAITGGAPPPVDPADSVRIIELLERVRSS